MDLAMPISKACGKADRERRSIAIFNSATPFLYSASIAENCSTEVLSAKAVPRFADPADK